LRFSAMEALLFSDFFLLIEKNDDLHEE
jgi:hypothetical protein